MKRLDQRGEVAVEAILITPVLVGLILVLAGAARIIDAKNQVASTAHIAARAASLTTSAEDAATAGKLAAQAALEERGRACADLDVHIDATDFQPGGFIKATVTCVADLSDVVGFGFPGTKTFSDEAVVPVETHRGAP
jgi:Flp pilus assembly protein TadG